MSSNLRRRSSGEVIVFPQSTVFPAEHALLSTKFGLHLAASMETCRFSSSFRLERMRKSSYPQRAPDEAAI